MKELFDFDMGKVFQGQVLHGICFRQVEYQLLSEDVIDNLHRIHLLIGSDTDLLRQLCFVKHLDITAAADDDEGFDDICCCGHDEILG